MIRKPRHAVSRPLLRAATSAGRRHYASPSVSAATGATAGASSEESSSGTTWSTRAPMPTRMDIPQDGASNARRYLPLAKWDRAMRNPFKIDLMYLFDPPETYYEYDTKHPEKTVIHYHQWLYPFAAAGVWAIVWYWFVFPGYNADIYREDC